MEELLNISPIDGRYRNLTCELSEYFSEYALIKYRVVVEIKWFIKLSEIISLELKQEDLDNLNSIIKNFNLDEAKKIKKIEETTNHDVKAVEYYLRDKFNELNISQYINYIHFACTSEDINNLAYNLMIKDGLKDVLISNMQNLISLGREKTNEWSKIPMLAHTHGQPASPTTVGKEIAVFTYRWESILKYINDIKLRGKFSGAVGNFNAHILAFPEIDWLKACKDFVESLGLEFNPLTTQIESHDIISMLFNYIKSFNNVTMDFNSDMWMYISMNYFKQQVVKNEVGSSVMPHKVNPINHENSMANIRMANAVLTALADNLPISRMQRDLSDSSSLRNIGVGFAHTIISIKQTIVGFNKMIANEEKLIEDLNNNFEILSEGIQTILRKNGYQDAYERLKELTRGQKVDKEILKQFIHGLDIDENDKKCLMELTPENYLGLSEKLTKKYAENVDK